MFTKQSCDHCGTNIEFEADHISDEGYAVSCPKCQGSVTLRRPPPLRLPPIINTRTRHHAWNVVIFVTACAVFLILLMLLIHRTPTSPVTGAFGFVLGEKYTNSPYGKWDDGWAGGFACYASPDSQHHDLPFTFGSAYADEHGIVYSIHASALDDQFTQRVLKATLEKLDAKYPLYRHVASNEWIFGNHKRIIRLYAGNPEVVGLEYRDVELQEAFADRQKKASDAAITGAVKRQHL